MARAWNKDDRHCIFPAAAAVNTQLAACLVTPHLLCNCSCSCFSATATNFKYVTATISNPQHPEGTEPPRDPHGRVLSYSSISKQQVRAALCSRRLPCALGVLRAA